MTPEDYSKVAEAVYGVDPLWRNPPFTKGDVFPPSGKPQFYVDDVTTDPVSGFQAMSVVPVLSEHPLVLDYSHVFVAFAGTNPDHRADILTDLQSVVGASVASGTQAAEAKAFAEKVRADLKKRYPDISPEFETVGHSLGGNLALRTGADLGWPSTSFNGPDPWDSLSEAAKKWVLAEIAAGRRPQTNYVNEFDLVGNSLGNLSGAAVYVKGKGGQSLLHDHNLDSAFPFDPDTGEIIGAGAKEHSLVDLTWNLLSGLPPAVREGAAWALATAMLGLRNPGVARTMGQVGSAAVVTIDTVAAYSLAASIEMTRGPLELIKSVNDGLVDQLQDGLDNATNTARAFPFITEMDIEKCIETHGLRVHQNINLDAVESVSRLVDDNLKLVQQLSEGISHAVTDAVLQDMEWAEIYGR